MTQVLRGTVVVLQSHFTQSDYGTNLNEKSTKLIICNSDQSFTKEPKHLKTVFIKNYSTDFIKRNTYIRPNNSCRNSYITTATIPLNIRKTSENHRLSTHTTTLQHLSCAQTHVQRLLANVEDKDKPEDRPIAVYKSLNRSNALTARQLISVQPAETNPQNATK